MSTIPKQGHPALSTSVASCLTRADGIISDKCFNSMAKEIMRTLKNRLTTAHETSPNEDEPSTVKNMFELSKLLSQNISRDNENRVFRLMYRLSDKGEWDQTEYDAVVEATKG